MRRSAFVVTTDGSIGDLPRENYVNAEEQTVQELEEIGKPYVVVLNSDETLQRGDRPHYGGTSGKVPDGGVAGELRAASQR